MPTSYPYVLYVTSAADQQKFVPEGETPPIPPDPIPTTEPRCIISLDGSQYAFVARDGTPLDPYYDPDGVFVMDNILCTHPSLPGFRAFYRPDRGTAREEWVLEYGDPWIPAPSANTSPYAAEFRRKDGTIITVQAPRGQYWYSRWRWQSDVRPVRRTYSQLAAQGLICNFDPSGLATGNLLTVSNYEPMATCGIPPDQGQTGGYPGLGIQTGWQTQYLRRGAPESSFRNQGEAAGSFQSHVRDTRTMAPIDIVTDYPGATMYSSSQGNPYFSKGKVVNKTDQGHMPSITYLPFLLTGDPYYLEGCQFWANHNMLTQPSNSRFMSAGRYLAWPLRAIYECVLATPTTVPSWLLPRSYWEHWLGVVRGIVENRMLNNSDPYYYVFHTIPDTGQASDKDPNKSGDHVWQQNMLDLVAAWVATTRDDWVDHAEWLMHNSVARASSLSGWCRSRPSPYHIRLQNASVLREAMTVDSTAIKLQYAQFFDTGHVVTIDGEPFTLQCQTPDGLDWTFAPRTTPKAHAVKAVVYGNKCLSWAEAAELNVFTYDWADTGDNDHMYAGTTDLTYHSYQRAALAQALHAGLDVPELQAAYTWLDEELRRFVTEKHLPIGDNWCVMPAPSVVRRKRHRRSDQTAVTEFVQQLIDEVRGVDE